MIAGKEWWVWVLCNYLWLSNSMIIDELVWIFDVSFMIKNMTSIEWYCLWIWYGWKVLILLVFRVILRLDFWWFVRWNFVDWVWFLVEFDWSLIFQGVEMIFESDFNDFIEFKSDKNVDFSMFCRTHYRTRKWQSTCG